MGGFISYNEYKNALNETFESFQELKILAKDLFGAFDKTLKIQGTQDKFYTQFKKNQIYYIKRIVKRKFKVIDEFVNSSIAIIRSDSEAFSRGSYVQPQDYHEIKSILPDRAIPELQQIYPNGIIVIYVFDINVIIHELEHAYDDFRAKGKLTKTKMGYRFEDKYRKFSKISSPEEKSKYYEGPFLRTYYRTPHEMSAFFTKALNMISFFRDKEELILREFQDVYEDFKDNFQGYNYLTSKDKKILLRKFSQYYYKMKERNIAEE